MQFIQYTLRLITITIALLAFSTQTVSGASEPVFSTASQAIRGYDPVAYFTQSQAVAGIGQLTHLYKNNNWYFSSTQNRDKFIANPQDYAPQYGGYCAYAMSFGKLASTDPEAWTIKQGKLYLNYNKTTRRIWLKDVDNNINKADKNWAQLLRR